MPHINNDVNTIEIPFEHRHHCWFCGEPSQFKFTFPPKYNINFSIKDHFALDCPHPSLCVPSCAECHRIAKQAEVNSIWAVNEHVKRRLI